MRFIDASDVRQRLTYEACIPIVREAMIAFSAGTTRQTLRQIVPLKGVRMFGVMPGALAADGPFGAKLISVIPDNFERGAPSHQGLIVLFEPETGSPVCAVDAGAVTAIRTAAASAAATDALARADAGRLALLGYGEQAKTHLDALRQVRSITEVRVWGRHAERAQVFAATAARETGLGVTAVASAREAVDGAEIVCTLTPATEPILEGRWLSPGAHVNLVGAGHAGQAEADDDLVVMSRFFVDSREGVIAQGGEFRRAKTACRVDDSHIVAEIGAVLSGAAPGRLGESEITVYKSLGHVAQDLASAWWLYTVD